MARELGLNPRKLGQIDNHGQERWKAPLPVFIEDMYFRCSGKARPDIVRSIGERLKHAEEKRTAKRAALTEDETPS